MGLIAKCLNYIFDKLKGLFLDLFIIDDFFLFKKMSRSGRFTLKLSDLYACVLEKTATTSFDRHYVYHTAWAARIVAKINPEIHTDIASMLYFPVILSAFVPVKYYDYRPARLPLGGLSSEHADLLKLPFKDGEVKSLSCMHALEHVGLGRYGDPIDPDGDLKAMKELKRVLTPGGSLLVVVPIGGVPKIQFNAHRIYSYGQIMEYFSDLNLKEFTLIHQYERDGDITYNASKELADKEKYGCGCFLFQKPN